MVKKQIANCDSLVWERPDVSAADCCWNRHEVFLKHWVPYPINWSWCLGRFFITPLISFIESWQIIQLTDSGKINEMPLLFIEILVYLSKCHVRFFISLQLTDSIHHNWFYWGKADATHCPQSREAIHIKRNPSLSGGSHVFSTVGFSIQAMSVGVRWNKPSIGYNCICFSLHLVAEKTFPGQVSHHSTVRVPVNLSPQLLYINELIKKQSLMIIKEMKVVTNKIFLHEVFFCTFNQTGWKQSSIEMQKMEIN